MGPPRQAVLRLLAKDLGDHQIQDLRKAFSTIDPSGTGISANRLCQVRRAERRVRHIVLCTGCWGSGLRVVRRMPKKQLSTSNWLDVCT